MQFMVEVWSDSSVSGSSPKQVFYCDHIFKHIHLIQKIVSYCATCLFARGCPWSNVGRLAFVGLWRSVAFDHHDGIAKDVFLDEGLLISGCQQFWKLRCNSWCRYSLTPL